MNATTLGLLLVLSACASGTTCPSAASPSVAPAGTSGRPIDVATQAPATVQRLNEKPPYESGAGLVPHEARKWVLVVQADGLGPNPSAFQVAETRVGDVPMGPRSPWRCRFDHAAVLEKYGSVARTVACSNDGWTTRIELTGGYCERPDCQMQESDVDLDLRSYSAVVGITFGPRRKLDDAKYPELP